MNPIDSLIIERDKLLEQARELSKRAHSYTGDLVVSLREYGDPGVSVSDSIDQLQRLSRVLGSISTLNKVIHDLECGNI